MTGVILLDKHEDITSFWAAAQLRRVTGEKKIGHTGTLDPMASGVLPILLGGATKFMELLPSHDKAYRATFRLGTVTDTLDITGTVLAQNPVHASAQDVENALSAFRGKIMQTPPMYSAVSKDGVRLYALARQGIEVERAAREIEVFALDILHADEEHGEYTAEIRCSAGTYVRSLVSDLGEALGCGAVLTALRRTAANGFSVEDAHTLDELRACTPEQLQSYVYPVDKVLSLYPAVTVTDKQAVRFCNGGALAADRVRSLRADGLYRVYAPDGRFLGLGNADSEKAELSVRRLLIER